LRRVLLALATAALLVAMFVASAVPAMAQVDLDGDGVLDDSSFFGDDNDALDDSSFFGDDNDAEEEDDDGGDEVDDVEVGDPFLDGNEVCIPVVTTFKDGSTDEDKDCWNASEFF
jgi:hypothetical protein